MRLRGKSIRRKIMGLLMVPLVSLTLLWSFAAVITFQESRQFLDVSYVVRKLGYPVADAIQAVQWERRQVMVYLADPRRSDALTQLHRRQWQTDTTVRRIRGTARQDEVREELDTEGRARLDKVVAGFDDLSKVRDRVEDNTISRDDAFHAYNSIIESNYRFLRLRGLADVELDREGRALVAVASASEILSREDALLAGALAADHMTERELRAFSDRVAERHLIYRTNLPSLPNEDRQVFESYWGGTDGRLLRKTEDAVLAAGAADAAHATTSKHWRTTTGTVLDELHLIDRQTTDRYLERVEPAAGATLVKAGIAGGLGFVALLVSVIVSVHVGRSLVRDLSALRKQAHESSTVRLPSVMRRLAAGDQIDVETEAPRLQYGQDELGQVGRALNTLQRSAVEAAVKQAELRKGVSQVFVNLARRSQVLLHRQLTLLDTLERRTEDPDELADLFRLDHLTTRMRRHAEGLVILSGAAPSRQWRKPVQLMDVVRAAVAEVEDYERIEVRRLPRLAVDGPAVGDLTHLIAELLENATVFSPPHTSVQVLGERVPNGFTLEIHDRGLGMTPEALFEANLRLAETAEFELSDTDRLGLLVVSRLAQRQDIRVSLQPSPYGGASALILIPGAVLTEAHGPADPRSGLDGDEEEPPEAGAPSRRPAPGPERQRSRKVVPPAVLDGPVDGPVELEAPLDALVGFEDDHVIPARRSLLDTVPVADSHQQTPDESERGSAPEPAGPAGRVPLPRRPMPVLVSDHGRPVDPDRRWGPTAARSAEQARHNAPDSAAGNRADRAVDNRPEIPRPMRPDQDRRGHSTTVSGLPRRVRQANLPHRPTSDTGARTDEPDGSEGRSGAGSGTGSSGTAQWQERDADEVRNRMAALQRGWQRGRRDYDSPEATDTPENTPAGKTSENTPAPVTGSAPAAAAGSAPTSKAAGTPAGTTESAPTAEADNPPVGRTETAPTGEARTTPEA